MQDADRLLQAIGGIASATAFLLGLVIVGASFHDGWLIEAAMASLGFCMLSYVAQLLGARKIALATCGISWVLGVAGGLLLILAL